VKLEEGSDEPTLHLIQISTEGSEVILPDDLIVTTEDGHVQVNNSQDDEEAHDPLLELGERKRKADPTPFKVNHCYHYL